MDPFLLLSGCSAFTVDPARSGSRVVGSAADTLVQVRTQEECSRVLGVECMFGHYCSDPDKLWEFTHGSALIEPIKLRNP